MRQTRNIESDQVQGPGSWVKMRSLLKAERFDLDGARDAFVEVMDKDDDGAEEQQATALTACVNRLIVAVLVDWNWSDEQGQPLTVPETVADLDGAITDQEANWLYEAMLLATRPSTDEKKD